MTHQELDALRERLEQLGTCEGCGKPMPSRYVAFCYNCPSIKVFSPLLPPTTESIV